MKIVSGRGCLFKCLQGCGKTRAKHRQGNKDGQCHWGSGHAGATAQVQWGRSSPLAWTETKHLIGQIWVSYRSFWGFLGYRQGCSKTFWALQVQIILVGPAGQLKKKKKGACVYSSLFFFHKFTQEALKMTKEVFKSSKNLVNNEKNTSKSHKTV